MTAKWLQLVALEYVFSQDSTQPTVSKEVSQPDNWFIVIMLVLFFYLQMLILGVKNLIMAHLCTLLQVISAQKEPSVQYVPTKITFFNLNNTVEPSLMATSLQFPLILSQGMVQTPTSEQFIKGCDNFPKQITPGSFISQGRK